MHNTGYQPQHQKKQVGIQVETVVKEVIYYIDGVTQGHSMQVMKVINGFMDIMMQGGLNQVFQVKVILLFFIMVFIGLERIIHLYLKLFFQ